MGAVNGVWERTDAGGATLPTHGRRYATFRFLPSWPTVALLIVARVGSLPIQAETVLPPQNCTCEKNRMASGWCEKCNLGHLAGVRIESKVFFELLDAHGHVIDPASLTCEKCRAAQKTQGYCDGCRMGFVRGMAYLSKLTYYLARGRATHPAFIVCKTCSENVKRSGWCEKCSTGMIGNVAITYRDDYDTALPEFQRLLEALKILPRCEDCAMAHFSGGVCTKCKPSPPAPSKSDATRGDE